MSDDIFLPRWDLTCFNSATPPELQLTTDMLPPQGYATKFSVKERSWIWEGPEEASGTGYRTNKEAIEACKEHSKGALDSKRRESAPRYVKGSLLDKVQTQPDSREARVVALGQKMGFNFYESIWRLWTVNDSNLKRLEGIYLGEGFEVPSGNAPPGYDLERNYDKAASWSKNGENGGSEGEYFYFSHLDNLEVARASAWRHYFQYSVNCYEIRKFCLQCGIPEDQVDLCCHELHRRSRPGHGVFTTHDLIIAKKWKKRPIVGGFTPEEGAKSADLYEVINEFIPEGRYKPLLKTLAGRVTEAREVQKELENLEVTSQELLILDAWYQDKVLCLTQDEFTRLNQLTLRGIDQYVLESPDSLRRYTLSSDRTQPESMWYVQRSVHPATCAAYGNNWDISEDFAAEITQRGDFHRKQLLGRQDEVRLKEEITGSGGDITLTAGSSMGTAGSGGVTLTGGKGIPASETWSLKTTGGVVNITIPETVPLSTQIAEAIQTEIENRAPQKKPVVKTTQASGHAMLTGAQLAGAQRLNQMLSQACRRVLTELGMSSEITESETLDKGIQILGPLMLHFACEHFGEAIPGAPTLKKGSEMAMQASTFETLTKLFSVFDFSDIQKEARKLQALEAPKKDPVEETVQYESKREIVRDLVK